jgi:hypothetical protein
LNNGANLAFLVPSLLAATSHLISKAEISTQINNSSVGMSLFTILSALEGTGKSGAQKIVSDITHKMEYYYDHYIENSSITNTLSRDNLICYLQKRQSLLGNIIVEKN